MNFNFFKAFTIVIFSVVHTNVILSEECDFQNNLKVGIIENDYIDYTYYLYYALGEYSLQNSINFEISNVKNNPDDFDIIFGEYNDLNKLSLVEIELPTKIKSFYDENKIQIVNNILPLDLDTFILISQNEMENLNFEELSEYYNSFQYTLGMSFKNKIDLNNLQIFITEQNGININRNVYDQIVTLFRKIYKNANKNNLNSDLNDIYSSYEESENIFTLFSDGILLYKNLEYESFQLFPKSKYYWNENDGIFIENLNNNPISFFGFSAYLNNTHSIDLVCYLLEEDVRLKAFQDFNIQLSPLSIEEIRSIEKLVPKQYLEILMNKNKLIYFSEKLNNDYNIEDFISAIIGNSYIQNHLGLYEYLN